MPQTLAATPIGTATVTGTWTPFRRAIWSLLRKFLRMSTLVTLTFTRPPWVLTWASAGVATAATAAAAIIILRIDCLQCSQCTKRDARRTSTLSVPQGTGGSDALIQDA